MKILIIEDDLFFRKFYTSQLTEAGHVLDTAENGSVGLKKIEDFKPDLVLLDIIMPDKDGFEVLETLSKNGSIKSLKIIVFSTLGQEQDIKRALELGAKAYINKSLFDLTTLLAKIKEIMEVN